MPSFDHIAAPDQIQPAYGFYAIFLTVGILFIILMVVSVRRQWHWRKSLLAFAPIWLVVVSVLAFFDAWDVFQLRKLVKSGRYTTIVGCLEAFHPGLPEGSKSTAGNERWSIAGQQFDYGQGEARPGYHLVEAKGGLVHADSRVRVTFVVSPYYKRKEIFRLQTLSPRCTAAPDKG